MKHGTDEVGEPATKVPRVSVEGRGDLDEEVALLRTLFEELIALVNERSALQQYKSPRSSNASSHAASIVISEVSDISHTGLILRAPYSESSGVERLVLPPRDDDGSASILTILAPGTPATAEGMEEHQVPREVGGGVGIIQETPEALMGKNTTAMVNEVTPPEEHDEEGRIIAERLEQLGEAIKHKYRGFKRALKDFLMGGACLV